MHINNTHICLNKHIKWKGDNKMTDLILQQVKAWYIYILGVKRLDFIIKSWITRYCSCKLVETSEHFLLKCSLYERLRNDLFVNLSSHLNINNLLFGDSNLPDCEKPILEPA
jgi:hypothetical protein